ncbi:MAG: tRNA (adenosine(37)-N6)-dimethylallyltransferase MiaA [Verrucomicrobia bacterium]|nr:tRNA (adenosine(37)-N6)-dimethylallyltransferase MiaA [Verrucomicrobiota bacterium]
MSDGTPHAPVFLIGPTAAGKTAVALELARRFDAEIVSADSMQVYRGMDIGTAKPSSAERAAVPHHLIDVVEVSERFDVARYVALANAAIAGIQRRGKTPLIVGGTGLYLRALTEGLSETPDAEPALRAELEDMGRERVLDELRRADPEAAARIGPHNFRRIVRALEICRLTGQRSSDLRRRWLAASGRDGAADPRPLMHGLERDRADLYARCGARVEAMFSSGLADEVRSLLSRGLTENTTACQALGYKEVIAHLRGEATLQETVALVKTRTRQFAKRQLTWFRHQARVEWIRVAADEDTASVVGRLAECLRKDARPAVGATCGGT